MVGAGILPDPALDPGNQVLGQAHALPQANEQYDPNVDLPLLANYRTFNDFRQLLHLAVDLGRADSYPARVQGCVASPQNDQTIVPGQPGPVSVAPDSRIQAEVRRVIFDPLRIVPESHRHAGERAS